MGIEVKGVCPLIQVFDMPRSVSFYRDCLGFALTQHSPSYGHNPDGISLFHWAMLRLGEAEIMLNTAYDEGLASDQPEVERVEAHADTTLYFGCPDVDHVYAFLVEKGLQVHPPKIAPYGMKQLSLKDPDGYGLCFQWPA